MSQNGIKARKRADNAIRTFAREWVASVYADPLSGDAGARAALDAINARRILAPVYGGAYGIDALNTTVERIISREKHQSCLGYYEARPLLVTRNDYAITLFNGDAGVCWPDGGGRMMAWFGTNNLPDMAQADDNDAATFGLRMLPLSHLPEVEAAWAMTIRRTQGSEYRDVLLVFRQDRHGDTAGGFLSPELFYTGATRASGTLSIVADEKSIRSAFANSAAYLGGLRARMAVSLA